MTKTYYWGRDPRHNAYRAFTNTVAEMTETIARAIQRDLLRGDEVIISDAGDAFDIEVTVKLVRKPRVRRCADCGEPGERVGHQTCQYPQDH